MISESEIAFLFTKRAGEKPGFKLVSGIATPLAKFPPAFHTLDCNRIVTKSMMSLYTTLGVFLLLAVRNPSVHRSLIAFAPWSSFAHALGMSLLAIPLATERV